jgi:hypothetical protein
MVYYAWDAVELTVDVSNGDIELMPVLPGGREDASTELLLNQ